MAGLNVSPMMPGGILPTFNLLKPTATLPEVVSAVNELAHMLEIAGIIQTNNQ